MDKYFNGLRYSSTLDCLIDDHGEKVRMRHDSFQIFVLLRLNLNRLVTREQLLSKVPSDSLEPDNSMSDHSLNECIDQIRHVVGNDRLKIIPHVGYLLTSDTTTDAPLNLSDENLTKDE